MVVPATKPPFVSQSLEARIERGEEKIATCVGRLRWTIEGVDGVWEPEGVWYWRANQTSGPIPATNGTRYVAARRGRGRWQLWEFRNVEDKANVD
jgi:hypothetical protein